MVLGIWAIRRLLRRSPELTQEQAMRSVGVSTMIVGLAGPAAIDLLQR
jgi:hypothetical protein